VSIIFSYFFIDLTVFRYSLPEKSYYFNNWKSSSERN